MFFHIREKKIPFHYNTTFGKLQQENGKILKWDMDCPSYTYVFDIYEERNKNLINILSEKKLNYIEINGVTVENRTNKSKELISLIKTKTFNKN